MAPRNHVLLFPDEHTDLLGAIHYLNVRSKTCHQLRTLFVRASAAVQEQAIALDSIERASIGAFEDLVELAERHVDQHRLSVVAESVLITTIQIAQLVLYVEHAAKLKRVEVDFQLTRH